jgi:hypothetical protein
MSSDAAEDTFPESHSVPRPAPMSSARSAAMIRYAVWRSSRRWEASAQLKRGAGVSTHGTPRRCSQVRITASSIGNASSFRRFGATVGDHPSADHERPQHNSSRARSVVADLLAPA